MDDKDAGESAGERMPAGSVTVSSLSHPPSSTNRSVQLTSSGGMEAGGGRQGEPLEGHVTGKAAVSDADPIVMPRQESWGEGAAKDANLSPRSEPEFDVDAAWSSLRANASKTSSQKIAAHLVGFLVAPRLGGIVEREARKGEKSAGLSPADFSLSANSDDGKALPHGHTNGATKDDHCESRDCKAVVSESQSLPPSIQSEEDPESQYRPDSIYGERLLLSLRCADGSDSNYTKRSQRDIVRHLRDLLTRVHFTEDVASDAEAVVAARDALVDALIMEALPSLVFTLLEGIETENGELQASCRELLSLLAKTGNPREFIVMLKMSLAKVNSMHSRAVCSLLLDDLLRLWTWSVPRISGRRALFLKDVVKVLDLCVFKTAGEDAAETGNESVNVNSCSSEVPSERDMSMLAFLEVLAATQRAEAEQDAASHEPGKDDPDLFSPEAQAKALHGMEGKSDENRERKLLAALRQVVTAREAAAQDWANERMGTLALLLRLITPVLGSLPAASADSDPRRVSLRKKPRSDGESKASGVRASFIRRARILFGELGFDNVVDACQRVTDLCGLEFLSTSARAVAEVARPQQRRNRKSLTFFGVTEVACYLVMMLTFSSSGAERTSIASALRDSQLYFLEPAYALDLFMPFVLHLLQSSSLALIMHGAEFLRVLMDRFPEGCIKGMTGALSHPYGAGLMQANGAWYGFAVCLVKSVGYVDDPADRAFVYETFQCLLKKFASPCTRFSVVEALVLESHRHVVSSQLITELKDCVRLIDEYECFSTGEHFRTRFAHFVFPRFLMPRKESLASVCTFASTCNAGLFLAMSDARRAASDACASNPDVLSALKARMQFCLSHLKLGREAVRAIAAVAEHDRKQTDDLDNPSLAKKASPEAHGLYNAATRTLNDCIASKSALDPAIACLSEALETM